MPTWTDFTRHPNYDAFWQRQAFAPYLTAVKLPILNVAGWWDQEDFYGPQKIYELMERHDTEQRNYFVAGPWNHGGWSGNGTQARRHRFRQRYRAVLPREDFSAVVRSLAARTRARWKLAEATVFETGANEWKEHEAWPPKQRRGGAALVLPRGPAPGVRRAGGSGFDEYVSDPANPCRTARGPCRRPIRGRSGACGWCRISASWTTVRTC